MSYPFELALRQYIAAFDGTGNNNISPAEFQTRFDNLYHQYFTFLPKDEKAMGEDGFTTIKSKEPLTRASLEVSGHGWDENSMMDI